MLPRIHNVKHFVIALYNYILFIRRLIMNVFKTRILQMDFECNTIYYEEINIVQNTTENIFLCGI